MKRPSIRQRILLWVLLYLATKLHRETYDGTPSTDEERQHRKKYTGEGSKTRSDIIAVLEATGPATKKELDGLLDVTTAGTHLPRMVEAGLLVIEPSTRPYRYHIRTPRQTEAGAA